MGAVSNEGDEDEEIDLYRGIIVAYALAYYWSQGKIMDG